MNRLIEKTKNIILDALFPPLCVSCKAHIQESKDDHICKKCSNSITLNKNQYSKKKRYILASASSYKNTAVRNLIHNLKYKTIKNAIIPLTTHVIEPYIYSIQSLFESRQWTIIPVPISKRKKRTRGFNQSSLIAQTIKDTLSTMGVDAHMNETALYKARNTKPQATLERKERKNNLKKSFALRNTEHITNNNILIVDDVYTSGSTIQEIIQTILKAKPKAVIVFTVAKSYSMHNEKKI